MTAGTTHLVDQPTAVYWLYDVAGRLLYVGASWDLETRWAGHRTEKAWWGEVDQSTTRVVWYDSREEALRAEVLAIALERPIYNIAGLREDRHRDPTVTVRPTGQVKDAATEALSQRGWTVGEALHAALLWILSDPAAALSELGRFRPPPKKSGRPPKKENADTEEAP